jgi:hypothetical protein
VAGRTTDVGHGELAQVLPAPVHDGLGDEDAGLAVHQQLRRGAAAQVLGRRAQPGGGVGRLAPDGDAGREVA